MSSNTHRRDNVSVHNQLSKSQNTNDLPAATDGASFSGVYRESVFNESSAYEEKASPVWYLYLVENRLGQLYTGITTDPKRRIAQHRGEKVGGAKALKGKSPLAFRAIFKLSNKSEAAVLECKVKKLTRSQKNKIILSGQLELTNTGSTLKLTCIKDELVE